MLPVFDPPVYISKVATMRRIQHHVSHGYHHFNSGIVPAMKAISLASKFAANYGVDRTTNQRYRDRAKGLSSVKVFFYPKANSLDLYWFLLATDGSADSPIFKLEKMKDTRLKDQRLHWNNEYEISRHNPKGQEKPSYSWQITAENWKAWQARIKKAATSRDTSLMRQAWWSLYRTPGFALIRKQVGQLTVQCRKEWRRNQKDSEFPGELMRLYYVTPKTDDQQLLSQLVYRAEKERVLWFGSDYPDVKTCVQG
ncbi:hypothetical protein HNQ57_003580 [Zhongshania antarctica]|uniref:Uncharacterized protein n=1 Tax=Zhongshania antarctica TaxID=641702 RepID=A0A840R8R1_9GAMM|nr:hypothetical protein [Zhongshania antarctica]MBB5189277.1 hypothetical protein [Zhongshania antarctica]